MLSLEIGRLIHEERKRDVERELTNRRLLHPESVEVVRVEARPCVEPAAPRRRHEAAGATS